MLLWSNFCVNPDLIARGKTWPEIAKHIDADEVIFQDLEDLKAACQEANEGSSHVEDFEVGVFCGKYVTDVPENYFEHLNDLRRGKRDKSNGLTVVQPGGDERTVVSSSGPANGPPSGPEADALRNANGIKTPEIREDIRCVLFDRDDASCLSANLSA
jgi:amidophosphoribosyltransferase